MKPLKLIEMLGIFLLTLHAASGFAENAAGERPVYTVEEGIRLALERNEDVLKAIKDLKYAGGNMLIHISDNLPQLSYSRDKDFTASGEDESVTQRVGIDQLLYRFGEQKTWQQEAFRKARRQVIDTMEEVIYQVRITFYEMLLSEKQILERKVLLSGYRKKLKREKAKHELGKIRKVDVLDVELQVTNEELMINTLKRELDYTKMKFITLIGEERKDFSPEGGFEKEEFDMEKGIANALSRRVELKNKQEDINIQKQIVREVFFKAGPDIAISGYMRPEYSGTDYDYYSLSLSKDKEGINAGFDYTDYDLGDLSEISDSPGLPEKEWGINFSLSFPLFERTRIIGERERALAELEKLEIELAEERKDIALEVEKAYNDLLNKRGSLNLQRKQLELRKKRWDILQKLMGIGQALYYEVVQAQDDFKKEEEKYFKMETEYMYAQENLKKTVGDYYPYIEKYYNELSDRNFRRLKCLR